MNSQSTEDESNDRPPSSPEDGEITDDEVCTEKNLLEVRSENNDNFMLGFSFLLIFTFQIWKKLKKKKHEASVQTKML